MTSTDRRRFLTAAVLGGGSFAGATALGSLAPEAAATPQPKLIELAPGTPDPNFATGLITKVDGSMLLVTDADRTIYRIRVTDGTSVWKLRPTTYDEVKLGDGLYARGVRMDDGTLAADALWVNIVNLDCHINAIESSRLHLTHHDQKIVGNIIKGTTAAVYGSAPAVADLSSLQVGKHVKIIGVWRPQNGDVDIATVYAAAA
jgi:hypothetical protein